MCPVCISTTAMMIAGASSTGGLGALLAKTFLGKRRKEKSNLANAMTRPEVDTGDERNNR
jgi:carbamate kinase